MLFVVFFLWGVILFYLFIIFSPFSSPPPCNTLGLVALFWLSEDISPIHTGVRGNFGQICYDCDYKLSCREDRSWMCDDEHPINKPKAKLFSKKRSYFPLLGDLQHGPGEELQRM